MNWLSRRIKASAFKSRNRRGRYFTANDAWSLLPLEPRVLLAGDAGVECAEVVSMAADVQPTPKQSVHIMGIDSVASSVVVFVDSRVDDVATLERGLAENAELVLIRPNEDGLEQISQHLSRRGNIQSVHIVGHGSSGELLLGRDAIDSQRLANSSEQIRGWGRSLVPGADILIYACELASGSAGVEFVHQLARLTGADVAASIDKTGRASETSDCVTADWDLELHVGAVETAVAFSSRTQERWNGVLATKLRGGDADVMMAKQLLKEISEETQTGAIGFDASKDFADPNRALNPIRVDLSASLDTALTGFASSLESQLIVLRDNPNVVSQESAIRVKLATESKAFTNDASAAGNRNVTIGRIQKDIQVLPIGELVAEAGPSGRPSSSTVVRTGNLHVGSSDGVVLPEKPRSENAEEAPLENDDAGVHADPDGLNLGGDGIAIAQYAFFAMESHQNSRSTVLMVQQSDGASIFVGQASEIGNVDSEQVASDDWETIGGHASSANAIGFATSHELSDFESHLSGFEIDMVPLSIRDQSESHLDSAAHESHVAVDSDPSISNINNMFDPEFESRWRGEGITSHNAEWQLILASSNTDTLSSSESWLDAAVTPSEIIWQAGDSPKSMYQINYLDPASEYADMRGR